jgi:hypothetical protein
MWPIIRIYSIYKILRVGRRERAPLIRDIILKASFNRLGKHGFLIIKP